MSPLDCESVKLPAITDLKEQLSKFAVGIACIADYSWLISVLMSTRSIRIHCGI